LLSCHIRKPFFWVQFGNVRRRKASHLSSP
jgi:hypothetical protein